ncbi:MAG: glycosyltransferase family 4 protein [Elusimicrobia bacterium]|nr:glycosyltransferase family 4 protein [Elusimicrobiota bacterium]
MTKVLFLDQDYEYGGAQKVLLKTLEKLDRNKFEPCLITGFKGRLYTGLDDIQKKVIGIPETPFKLGRESIRVKNLLFAGFFSLVFLFRLIIEIKKSGPKLIYTNTVEMHLLGSLAGFISSTPVIWRVHDIMDSEAGFNNLSIKTIRFFSGLGKITALPVSGAVEESMIESSMKTKEIIKLYNGVEIDSNARGKSESKEPGITLGWMGRVTEMKNPEMFIRAALKILDKPGYPPLRFLIAGEALPEEAELLEKLKLLAGESKEIIFEGYVENTDKWLRQLDIFVHTSYIADSLPTSVMEAMSAGLAVIAADTGGVKEIINNRGCGIIYGPYDQDALEGAILSLLDNAKKRKELAKEGRQHIKRKFSEEIYMEKFQAILSSSLEQIKK